MIRHGPRSWHEVLLCAQDNRKRSCGQSQHKEVGTFGCRSTTQAELALVWLKLSNCMKMRQLPERQKQQAGETKFIGLRASLRAHD